MSALSASTTERARTIGARFGPTSPPSRSSITRPLSGLAARQLARAELLAQRLDDPGLLLVAHRREQRDEHRRARRLLGDRQAHVALPRGVGLLEVRGH